MAETSTAAVLPPDAAARLTDFARACKAAARAVSLYPGGHPAIGTTLGKLSEVTARLTESGPYRIQVVGRSLLVDGAGVAKPDPGITELAELLQRHVIGGLTLNGGIDADSWRTLLLLLARAPDEVRADGGIARLWKTAGGPSIEIKEIDYAEVLREKQGMAAGIEEIIKAALAGPQLQMDDSGMQLLLEIIDDPAKLDQLMAQMRKATGDQGADAMTTAFLSLLRGLTEWTAKHDPSKLEKVLNQMGRAAGKLTADGMLSLLEQRKNPDAAQGTMNVAGAVVDRMTDNSVASFVAGNVIEERGASERLAHAFQALVPDVERQRQLLAIAEEEVSESELGQEQNFKELWERIETMLTSYSDEKFVSKDYARELQAARTQATDVEKTSDDPPERVAAWLSTVADAALRSLDHQLLLDLLTIEPDPLRWRDIADTAVSRAEDLVRVNYFDQAWSLTDAVVEQGVNKPERRGHAISALERLGRGSMMKHVAPYLRSADEAAYERFKTLCHAIGTPLIAPLAETLSAEQDARSRRRLRDVLLGFGAKGRESVQQLMHAPNWEVRRTAAFLLREFGGAEGLKELIPLLSDAEPLVQREAVQGLVMNGSKEASEILLKAINSASGRSRDTLIGELTSIRDASAAPVFAYLLRHLNRRSHPHLYQSAIDALGAHGNDESVEALKFVLYQGDWLSPMATKRFRESAANALRKLGTPAAFDALRDASENGPRAVRNAAKAALSGVA